jgi:hypothetical protein
VSQSQSLSLGTIVSDKSRKSLDIGTQHRPRMVGHGLRVPAKRANKASKPKRERLSQLVTACFRYAKDADTIVYEGARQRDNNFESVLSRWYTRQQSNRKHRITPRVRLSTSERPRSRLYDLSGNLHAVLPESIRYHRLWSSLPARDLVRECTISAASSMIFCPKASDTTARVRFCIPLRFIISIFTVCQYLDGMMMVFDEQKSLTPPPYSTGIT